MELIGKSVFGGVAIGKLSIYQKQDNVVKRQKIEDTEAEVARFHTAKETAKEQLLRTLDDFSDDPRLATLEKKILRDANTLGIGPMGLGGKTTLLGVKIAARPRVPASFFVTVAYMCWACRRGSLTV